MSFSALTLLARHGADTMSIKTKEDQTTGFSCSALTLQIEWQEEHPAHKNSVVVPVRFTWKRAVKWHVCVYAISSLFV